MACISIVCNLIDNGIELKLSDKHENLIAADGIVEVEGIRIDDGVKFDYTFRSSWASNVSSTELDKYSDWWGRSIDPDDSEINYFLYDKASMRTIDRISKCFHSPMGFKFSESVKGKRTNNPKAHLGDSYGGGFTFRFRIPDRTKLFAEATCKLYFDEKGKENHKDLYDYLRSKFGCDFNISKIN